MEILNIGPLELIIIVVLMFIILGPKDMVKTAQRIGGWVRSVTRSPMWREVWGISQDIRDLPKKLIEETGLDEALTDVQKTTQEVTNELNAQLNEVKEAARVQEVEHLRIGTPPTAVPAALTSGIETPVNGNAVQPAELNVAGLQAEGETSSAEAIAAAAAAAAPVKKSRRKKAIVGDLSLSEPVAPFWPETQFFSLEATVPWPSNGQQEGAAMEPAAITPEPGNGTAKPARVRKPRKPKVEVVDTAAVETTAPEAVATNAVLEADAPEADAPEADAPEAGANEPDGNLKMAEADPTSPNGHEAQPDPEADPTSSNGHETQPDPDAAQLDRDAA